MNPRQTTVLVFSILAAIPTVGAQTSAPSPNTAAASVAPTQETRKPSVRTNPGAGPNADARICLQFPTNGQIIACAEKYRPQKRSA